MLKKILLTILLATSNISGNWRILLYLDSSDNLSHAMIKNLTDIARGYKESTDQSKIKIFIQLHSIAKEGLVGKEAYRYRVTNSGLEICETIQITHDTSQDLFDAAQWAFSDSSQERHMLILGNHGFGSLTPIWKENDTNPDWDAQDDILMHMFKHKHTSKFKEHRALMLQNNPKVYLKVSELAKTLSKINNVILKDKTIELLCFDMCLMSMLEVATLVAPYARYMIASQESEPDLGWDYYTIFKNFSASACICQCAQLIVESYHNFYSKVYKYDHHTLSAIKLKLITKVSDNFDKICKLIEQETLTNNKLLKDIKELRLKLPCFHIVPMYTDLYCFYQELNEILDQQESKNYGELSKQLSQAKEYIEHAVLINRTGPKRANTRGISFYFPLSHVDTSYTYKPDSWQRLMQRIIE